MTGAEPIPYDRVAADYDRTRGGLDRGGDFAATIVGHLPAATGRPVLDVGVGTGALALPLRELAGRPVVGVDLSLPMLRHASPRLPGGVARADARRLPCRDGCADAVVLCWVLHAVGDPVAAMTEAARALRPGGRAFVFEGDGIEEGDVTLPTIYRRVAAHAGRPSGDERYGIALDAAARAGFELVAEELTPARRWGQTPADLAETLRQRGAGFLDRMDDATFARVVEPAIDELLAMPEPDRPRLRVNRHRLAVLQHE